MSVESVMFEKLAEAIKSADIPQIKSLFNQARVGLNSDILLSQVDGNGDTLLHLLFRTGNIQIPSAAIASYEEGFWPCLDVTNATGEKPLDIVEKSSLENTEFKQRIRNYFSPSFAQDWILKQFRQYLKLQNERDPESYKLEDVTAIIQALKPGHCSGFAAFWAQGCLEDGKPDQEYADSLKDVVYWDETKESLIPEVVKEFERAISLVRFDQATHLYPERVQWDKDREPYQSAEFLQLHQKDWDIIWEKDKYQGEGKLEIKQIKQDMFKEYIAEFAIPENNGKVVGVTTNEHAVSFFYKDNTFHVFDSNYRGGGR